MKKFFKSVIAVGAVAGLSYLGFKGYKRLNDVTKMSKTLPDHLNELLGETPKVDINQKLNSLSIAVGLTANTYENLVIDLEEQIDSYVTDYYPNLSKLKLTITKYIKADEEEESSDETECECGCEQKENEEKE